MALHAGHHSVLVFRGAALGRICDLVLGLPRAGDLPRQRAGDAGEREGGQSGAEDLVRTGDQVKKGQALVLLDNAVLEAQVSQAKASLAEKQDALSAAEADLEMTIRRSSAGEEQATAAVSAAKARLAQAQAEMDLQAKQQPDDVKNAEAHLATTQSESGAAASQTRPRRMARPSPRSAAEAQLTKATTTLAQMEKLRGYGRAFSAGLDTTRSRTSRWRRRP